MKVILIRHGATAGNLQGRYVGSTDEPVAEASYEEIRRLKENIYDKILCFDGGQPGLKQLKLYVSPMKRAIETAQILFPETRAEIMHDFRECDFGEFEYKCYEELRNEPEYQRFIDTMGESGFPGGETKKEFQERSCACYKKLVRERAKLMVIVAHGGTIMSILDRYSLPHRDYYDWQIKPAEGFAADMDEEGILTNIAYISNENA